jgi:DnaJ-class molecular chaperone
MERHRMASDDNHGNDRAGFPYDGGSGARSVVDVVEDADPYVVLGVQRTASWEQITRAHRQLVLRVHPDRYANQDEALRDTAELRIRQVNEAFAKIRRQRGGLGG